MYYYRDMKTLSKSHEDYIEAIYLIQSSKQKVLSVEIARVMNVSKPAVHNAMDELLNSSEF